MLNIVVLVSGGGTNLQALIDAQNAGTIQNGKISCVISSNPNAYALERAKQHHIPTVVLNRKEYPNRSAYNQAILNELNRQHADLIVLAGFMTILGKEITDQYAYRIMNVHPALIPSFCGEGFYGLHVHEKVLEYGVKVTGATVHFVNEQADAGAIILQKPVYVENGDTPEILQKRVMEQAEWEILPKAVSLFCQGAIQMIDGKAIVTPTEE
jgi:phosphoribosylglycinamide formyltransferase-1